MKKITILLFLTIATVSITAQNNSNNELTKSTIDSLRVQLTDLVSKIEIARAIPPKIPSLNKEENTINLDSEITLSEECGVFANNLNFH